MFIVTAYKYASYANSKNRTFCQNLRMSKICCNFAAHFELPYTMINRSVHMIFEPSGQPIPSEEEVQFEAREIVSRSGWGLPLIEALRKVGDPYWREAVTRCLMDKWNELVRDKDERTYYYDSDGDIRYCWMDAEYDFGRIIRRCTSEQVDMEQAMPIPQPVQPVKVSVPKRKPEIAIYIKQHNGPIITDSHVTIYSE